MDKPGCSNRGSKRSLSEMTDEELKEKGNCHYKERNFKKALDCYSCAIIKNPSIPIYFTNRGLTAYRLRRFAEAVANCLSALELEPENYNARYTLGLALCSMKKFDEGLAHITNAIKLGQSQSLKDSKRMEKGLQHMMQVVEKEKAGGAKEEKAKMLQAYLSQRVDKDRESQLEQIRPVVALDSVEIVDRESLEAAKESQIVEIEKHFKVQMTQLNALYNRTENKRKEVPTFSVSRVPQTMDQHIKNLA